MKIIVNYNCQELNGKFRKWSLWRKLLWILPTGHIEPHK